MDVRIGSRRYPSSSSAQSAFLARTQNVPHNEENRSRWHRRGMCERWRGRSDSDVDISLSRSAGEGEKEDC